MVEEKYGNITSAVITEVNIEEIREPLDGDKNDDVEKEAPE